MAIQLVEMKFGDEEITGRLADGPAKETSKVWIEFRMPSDTNFPVPTVNGDIPLGDYNNKRFVTVQQAILRYVRDAIGAETQRLAALERL